MLGCCASSRREDDAASGKRPDLHSDSAADSVAALAAAPSSSVRAVAAPEREDDDVFSSPRSGLIGDQISLMDELGGIGEPALPLENDVPTAQRSGEGSEPALPLENDVPTVQSSGEGGSSVAAGLLSQNCPKDSELRSHSSKEELLAATKIQARARGASARRKSMRQKKSAVQIQAHYRGSSSRKKLFSGFKMFNRNAMSRNKKVNRPIVPEDLSHFLLCPNGHKLSAHVSSYEWMCDKCHTQQVLGALVHTCHHAADESHPDPCDYDVCDTCYRNYGTPKKPAPMSSGDFRVDAQEIPKAPKTPTRIPLEEGPPHLMCPKGHQLHKHVSDYEWNCNRCNSSQIIGSLVYTCEVVDGADACDYDVCSDCCMDVPAACDHPTLSPHSVDNHAHYYVI